KGTRGQGDKEGDKGNFYLLFCLLPSALSLLPSAFCLLPSAFCLLAFYLLPSAFCLALSNDK
ncbi:hypothetical protein, partial [[Phormidium] sp. LEGE 05292]|uniref:hypothetical protein n=1 Tax=[Phormidium] sp. LEGE 05292 TaxID=767427 RepID=UPI001D14395B